MPLPVYHLVNPRPFRSPTHQPYVRHTLPYIARNTPSSNCVEAMIRTCCRRGGDMTEQNHVFGSHLFHHLHTSVGCARGVAAIAWCVQAGESRASLGRFTKLYNKRKINDLDLRTMRIYWLLFSVTVYSTIFHKEGDWPWVLEMSSGRIQVC